MDFNDTPEQAAFRKSAADWLAANVPSKEEIKGMSRLEFAKMWQKRKYDAGWACIGWDPAYGGRGASTIEQVSTTSKAEIRFEATITRTSRPMV